MSKVNRANGRAGCKASRLMTSLNNDELGKMKWEGGLVDVDLPLEAQQWRCLTIDSQIADERRRASAIFLGSDSLDQVERSTPVLMSKMLLECLVSFVHSRGAKVAWSTRFSSETLNVAQQTVRVDGEVRQFLSEGQLFIYSDCERVVVTAVSEQVYPPTVAIEVHSNQDSAAFLEEWEEYARANNYLRGQAFFADGELIEPKESHTWDSIVLSDAATRTIQTHVSGFFRDSARLKSLGVKARRGLILAGPPGTGKTLLGKVLANTLAASFVWVTPRHIREPESFEDILSVARFVSPTVVFLEDLDLFGEERGRTTSMSLGELMNQLDGASENNEIVAIATTNRLDVVEDALRNRPGRFDRVVAFDAMDTDGREVLLGKLLENADVSPEDREQLVATSEGYTGAQIQELINTLYIHALHGESEADIVIADGATPQRVSITKDVVAAALADFQVEQKTRIGFH
jgi:ATP-dependent 26S proteasome regulatory subunit